MRIYNHLKKIISIIIERTPLKGIKFIIEHYIIHENYYISFNIFIYSFIIFLVDSNFCGNIVITIIEDEFITIVFGFIAAATTLFGIISPLVMSLFIKFTFELGLQLDLSNTIKAIKDSLAESVFMLIGFFIAFLILESNIPGFRYSNEATSVFLIFFLLSICYILYDTLQAITRFSLNLISMITEEITLKIQEQAAQTSNTTQQESPSENNSSAQK